MYFFNLQDLQDLQDFSDLLVSKDIRESLVWLHVKHFLPIQKSTFFRKKQEFVSKHVNIAVIVSLSSDSMKILKRCKEIFKKLRSNYL